MDRVEGPFIDVIIKKTAISKNKLITQRINY